MGKTLVMGVSIVFAAILFVVTLRENTTALSHAEMRLKSLEARQRETQTELDAARAAVTRLQPLRNRLVPDIESLYETILHPSVQVSGRSGVGGGVILHSRGDSPENSETYVVTAFHVIQKVVRREDEREVRDPVEVRFYGRDGAYERSHPGELVLYDEKQDVALIRVPGTGRLPNSARLASRETLAGIRVFTPVYAVGCPLGHDPLPSPGEISTLNKEVNGAHFWMMNAPTIYGNSGGGIFHRDTHELLGISAMICTYDNQGSTPVPHLGIMVSLETLYGWLDRSYYQFVYDPAFTPEDCTRARRRAEGSPPTPGVTPTSQAAPSSLEK